jgi:hypothetical protein
MNCRSVCEKLSNICYTFLEESLALDMNEHKVKRLAPDAECVIWSSTVSRGLADVRNQYGLVEAYLDALRHRDFSLLLNDGAVVQISYRYKSRQMIAHRLSYMPCPFDLNTDLEIIMEYGLLDYIEAFKLKNILEDVRLRSTIRFDYDEASATELHPASHMTMNKETCRIPMCAPVSLKEFLVFLNHHFYPEWPQSVLERAWTGIRGWPRVVSTGDERRMHLNWPTS